MFGILGVDQPSPTSCTVIFFSHPSPPIPSTTIESHIMDVSKYTQCLSQWPEHLAPGLPTIGALLLLGTGGLVVACKVWSFLRVLLSLFVLPGKPVSVFLLRNILRLSYGN
jgi:hypothetical protein